MKLLIISQHIGRTAPGKVFEALVKEIFTLAQVDIICNNFNPSDQSLKTNKVFIFKEPKLFNNRMTAYADRIFNVMFGISWRDWKIGRTKIKLLEKYDAILALGSSRCLSSLQLAKKIKSKLKVPLYIYLVDACPTPDWWNPPIGQFGVHRFLKRVSKQFNYFASSNPQMLEYQKKHLSPDNIKGFDVLYTPSFTKDCSCPRGNDNIVFTYIGSLYGIRTPKYLIEAFRKFIKEFPEARLVFVGNNPTLNDIIPKELLSNIEIKPFTDEPKQFYKEATALIDIDADYDDDIFLSSKFANYIFVDRPIICETGKNSPLRKIVGSRQSIFLCQHDSNDLYEALKKSIKENFDYMERDDLKKIFSPIYNAKKILNTLHKEVMY